MTYNSNQFKQWRQNNLEYDKERKRRWWRKRGKDLDLRRKYNISIEDYNQLLEEQNYSCAICNKHESEEDRSLCVDHDHKSGKVRGLLCYYCNRTFIGNKTSSEMFRKAAEYLDGKREKVV